MNSNFKELYCNNFNRIKNFANTYLRDEETAVSVTQDVFMQVLENKENFCFNETLLPYLFVLTKNRCINILKKEKAKKTYQKDRLYQFNIDISLETLENLHFNNFDFSRLQQLYKDTLASMPDNTRDTFLLSRDKNLKYTQIAQIQGVSVKTVEYRIMFALRVLREKLKDYLILIISLLYLW